jgi:hypothetical protein
VEKSCLESTRSALYEVTCYTFPRLPTDPRLGRIRSEDYREAYISFHVLKIQFELFKQREKYSFEMII